jgi:hypothetical protein
MATSTTIRQCIIRFDALSSGMPVLHRQLTRSRRRTRALDSPSHASRCNPPARFSLNKQSVNPLRAVRSMDQPIASGRVALLGPNGAGKTTTIDMMLGLTRLGAGMVSALGGHPAAAVRAGWTGGMLQAGSLLEHPKVQRTGRADGLLLPAPAAWRRVLRRVAWTAGSMTEGPRTALCKARAMSALSASGRAR